MISKVEENNQIDDEQTEVAEKFSNSTRIVAQEIKMAKALAGNSPTHRAKQLKKLKKWLNIRLKSSYPFTDENFLRIWKGLHYSMWMSDKPLVQEQLAEDFGSLLNNFDDCSTCVQFFGAFLKMMAMEWFGIDQWRLDKFLMLVRRMFRHMFIVLKKAEWDSAILKEFNNVLEKFILKPENIAIGLVMHIADIYLEELAKASTGKISAKSVVILLRPFIRYLAKQKDLKLATYIQKRIFYHLLFQSERGREYAEKYEAWQQMGFPTAHIDDLEKFEEDVSGSEAEQSDSEESQKTTALDPRAGGVDVIMPELPIDGNRIAKEFEIIEFKVFTNTKSRKLIRNLIEKYTQYAQGEFPLGIKTVPKKEILPMGPLVDEKVDQLEKLENELYATTRNLKKLGKKKRKRLLSEINFDAPDVNEENFEKILKKALPTNKTNKKVPKMRKQQQKAGEWHVENIQNVTESENVLEIQRKKKKMENLSSGKTGIIADIEKKKKKNKKQSGNDTIKEKHEQKLRSIGISKEEGKIENDEKKKKKEILKELAKARRQQKSESEKKGKKKSKQILNNTADSKTEQVPEFVDNCKENFAIKKSSKSEWDDPIAEGEVEYFIPSRKIQLLKANEELVDRSPLSKAAKKAANLVLNPFAKDQKTSGSDTPKTPTVEKSTLLGKKAKKTAAKSAAKATNTSSSPGKRVKIVLNKNRVQHPLEYLRQVKDSPEVPHDPQKMPIKASLKPNLMPSPINPFYRIKMGIKLPSDTP